MSSAGFSRCDPAACKLSALQGDDVGSPGRARAGRTPRTVL